MATPRVTHPPRRARTVSRLLARLLAPFVGWTLGAFAGSWALAQTVPAPHTLPQGGQVKVGAGQLTQQGNLLLIQQLTPRLGLDWQSFSIGRDATVEFRQPGSASIALNRVIGPDASSIFGRLVSNGQVFLTNPSGILFAPGAQVDVGSLVASTLDLSQADFAAGQLTFTGAGGSVTNQGAITASGYVALFGGEVANAGDVTVPAGSVVLASGRSATVSLSDNGLLSAVVTPGDPGSVVNSGRIAADGGSVRLSAASAEGLAASLVNNTGLVRANSIVERAGEIHITGDAVASSGQLVADGRGGASAGRIVVRGGMAQGRLDLAGTVSAQALDAGGSGGQVETSAALVRIDEGTRVSTLAADGRHGQWLIDPTDFIVSAGGGVQTTSGIGASTLSANLQSGNVTLLTASGGGDAGDIRIEAPVSWTASTTLTLSAIADIEINANLTATGNAAGLTISAGSGRYTLADGASISLPGSSPSLSINGESFVVINSLAALQAINTDSTSRSRNYALGSDIDASDTVNWNDGAGFVPIGNSSAFTGDFDGLGHRISGLTINRPNNTYTGLFGYTQGSRLRHLTLAGGNILGGAFTGALVGYLYGYNSGTAVGIESVRSDVPVTAVDTGGSYVYVGGLAGYQYDGGGVANSHSTGTVLADSYFGYVGGLIGRADNIDQIQDSSASGRVELRNTGYSTSGYVGGLVGQLYDAAVRGSQASGSVRGGDYAGGLVGQLSLGSVTGSSASGAVDGARYAMGGLVGYASSATLSDVSASGAVTIRSGANAGGLVGELNSSTLALAQASGAVQAPTNSSGALGGAVGQASNSTIDRVTASGAVTADATYAYAGGLAGTAYYGSIVDSSASGNVSTLGVAGGLVGNLQLESGDVLRGSSASGDVRGLGAAGGLVGDLRTYNYSGTENVAVLDSHATGNVTGRTAVGGLVGRWYTGGSGMESVFATGRVSVAPDANGYGQHSVGGLIGEVQDDSAYYSYYYGYAGSTLRRSFASGDVVVDTGADTTYTTVYAGGLVGFLNASYYYYTDASALSLTVSDSFATGRVDLAFNDGVAYAGGLVGYNSEVNLLRTYASGAVTVAGAGSVVGGLVGQQTNYYGIQRVVDSYWNVTTTGMLGSAGGGTGLFDADMKQAASFVGWDLATTAGAGQTWRLYEGLGQPLLSNFLTPLTLVLTDQTRVYDGTSSLAVGNGQILVAGLSPDVGSSFVDASLLHSGPLGYDLQASGNAMLTITQRPLSLLGAVVGKVYDGNVDVVFATSPQLTGLVPGEALALDLSGAVGAYDDRNVGVGKNVTVSGVGLGSTATGNPFNYALSTTTVADITPRPVTAGGFTATSRAYDGTTAVAVSFAGTGSLANAVPGDDLGLLDAGAFGSLADKNAGLAKTVTVGGVSLTGGDAGNYTLAGADSLTVDITPKVLQATGITASNRVYNSGTSISINANGGAVTGVVAGDQALYAVRNPSGQMADRHVGEDKPVTVSGLTLVGPDAANYSVQASGVTVDITPRSISPYIYGIYNSSALGYGYKVYDGSADASAITGVDLSGDYSIDALTLSWTSVAFADKNVAYASNGNVTDRTITLTGFAIGGPNVGNYTLSTTTAATSGRIVPRALTVSGVSAVDRVYDGTVNVAVRIAGATVDPNLLVPGDDVAITVPGEGDAVGTMVNRHVGTNKAVTVPGLALAGNDARNYTLTGSNGVTVDITPKNLTASYTGQNKVYDGNVYAAVTTASADIVGGDSVLFYSNACGFGCGYAFFTGDGAKDVGTDKPIAISYDYIYGNQAGNYVFVNAGQGTATGSISPRQVTPSVTGVSKVYDGTAAATVTLNSSASGIIGGDIVSVGTSNAVFTAGKNVGNGKAIAVSDITLSGSGATNYTLASTTASTSANITPKLVNVTGIAAVDRVYDGTAVVAVLASNPTVEGLVALDDVQAVLPVGGISSGTMADRHAGNAKPVAVTGLSLSGTDAGNYTLGSSGGTVNIAPKPIGVQYTGVDKVYDGNTNASVSGALVGLVSGVGDSVGFSQSAVFSGPGARNAGLDKPVAVSNIVLNGAQRNNYVLESTTASTTADITPKPISVAYTGISRVYNGQDDLSASVIPTATGLVQGVGDSVSLNQTARFATDGSAGANKTVNVTEISLAGVNAGNYLLGNTTATTTANITPRLLGVAGMSAVNRVYDGTTTVQVNVTGAAVDLTGVLGDDEVTVSLPPQGITTGAMVDKHVGQNKPVSVTGLLLGGNDAANYALTGADALTVDIGALGISVVFTGIDKEYDGSTTAQVLGAAVGANPGDSLGVSASALFTGAGARNVGTDKPVAVSNALLTGADRFNYVLLNRDGSTTASITPRTLTPLYTGGTRAYDGGVTAPVSVVLSRLVGGDAVSATQSAVFTGDGAKNVGTGKPVAVSGLALSGADAGNYTLASTSGSTTASITPRLIVVEGVSGMLATPRPYDGTTQVVVTVPEGISGTPREGDVLAGEQVLVQVPAAGQTTGTMADKHAGTAKPVQVTGLGLSGTDAGNYAIASAAGVTVDISRLGISAFYDGLDKVYDGGTAAQVQVRLDDKLVGDVLSGSATGVFTGGKNVGQNLAVAVSGGTLAGADARNYSLLNPTGATSAEITPRSVTAVYSGGSKVYDGSTAAPVTGSISGLVGGDSVALAQTAVFSGGKNVGVNKAIAVSAIGLSGADGANYQLANSTATTTGSVTQRPVVVEGLSITAEDRVYDGSTQVVVQVQATAGAGVRPGDLIEGDQVAINLPGTGQTTGTMADKNAGRDKALTVTGLSLSGSDAGNYLIVGADGLTVDIAPRTLSAIWTGVDKVYDGTAVASAIGSASGIVAGDVLSLAASGVFSAGKNVGNGLAVELQSLVLAGADAGNYLLDSTTGSTTASITPRTLQVAYTGGTRAYDGTTLAPVTGALGGLVAGDTVTLSQTAVFSGGKNVGTAKAISVSGIALEGADAGNYRSDIAATSTTGSVTPRGVVIDGLSATAASRVYDGTTTVAVDLVAAAGVAPRAGDLIAGDEVTVSVPATGQSLGAMADKNVGTGKAVVISGLGLSGADAANYRIVGVDGVTVDITPRLLTATWTGQNKVYDGTAAATAIGSAGGIVGGDLLTLSASGVFDAGKNVGSALAITLQGAELGGADAGNYALANPTGSTTASILPKTVVALYTGVDKVYDADTAAQVAGRVDGLVAGDTLTLSQSAVFSTGKNAGTNKPVLVAGITLDGTDAGNYRLVATETATTASITPRPLDVTGLTGLAAVARTYDGTRTVQLTGTAEGQAGLQGVLGTDDVRLAQGELAPTAGTLPDKNAGLARAVAVEGLGLTGADAGNYLLGGVVGLTVDIAPLPVALSGLLAVNRVYDGTRAVAIDTRGGSIAGVLAGDDLQLLATGVTGSVADKTVGTARPVTLDGVAFAGADAGNYAVQAAGLQVDITPRSLVVAGTAQAKVYDGSTAASVLFTDDRVAGDQLAVGLQSAAFADRNAGTARDVGVSGLALSGADAANYVLASDTMALRADILPRPLTLTASDAAKVYGVAQAAASLRFTLAGAAGNPAGSGLVDGERIDTVALASAGLPAGADAGTYAITAAGAQGLGFDPANYALSYVEGRLTVTPRPLTIAMQWVLRTEGSPNPDPWGFASAEGGLVNGDTLLSVVQPPVPGADAGVGIYRLAAPTGARFATGLAANYDISYQGGQLTVLPRQPSLDDADGGNSSGGGESFVLENVPPEQVAAAVQALRRSAAAVRAAAVVGPAGPDRRAVGADDPAEVLAAVLRGETRRITLATLLRLPMLSIDPQLQRLLDAGARPSPDTPR